MGTKNETLLRLKASRDDISNRIFLLENEIDCKGVHDVAERVYSEIEKLRTENKELVDALRESCNICAHVAIGEPCPYDGCKTWKLLKNHLTPLTKTNKKTPKKKNKA